MIEGAGGADVSLTLFLYADVSESICRGMICEGGVGLQRTYLLLAIKIKPPVFTEGYFYIGNIIISALIKS